MQLAPGTRVNDRYDVVEELARGGVGVVYVAVDTRFGQRVALKVASGGEQHDEFRERFRREATIGYLLGKSPGFVRALDWGDLNEDSLFMILDLVEGARELSLEQGPRQQRLRRVLEATERVAVLHGEGVVHRDIKPANFLITDRGELLMTDFGLAKVVGRPEIEASRVHLTQVGALVGTPLYMPPEQFQDPSGVERPSDVYSLGVMLHVVLTGEYPYPGRSPVEIMSRQVMAMHGDGSPLKVPHEVDPRVGEELSMLSLEAIDLEADRRPTAAELAKRLRAALQPRRQRPPRTKTRASLRRVAPPKPSRPPVTREVLVRELGLDAEGFVDVEELRSRRDEVGSDQLTALLRGVPALLAAEEREVNGTRRYQGRVAFLVPREPGDSRDVTLGRTEATDITVALVTVSKTQLSFHQDPDGWTVLEHGSSNGTELNGVRLAEGKRRALSGRDELRLSQHLTLRYLPGEELLQEL